MNNPSALINALVSSYRTIPALVALLGGKQQNIFAYHDVYPENASVVEAVMQLQPGQMMIAWNGSSPAPTPMGFWSHAIKIFIRASEEAVSVQPSSYYEVFRLAVDGVATGTTIPMRDFEVVNYCDPMTDVNIDRSTDPEGVDYFEISMNFVERLP
jgi:hypothetical protein